MSSDRMPDTTGMELNSNTPPRGGAYEEVRPVPGDVEFDVLRTRARLECGNYVVPHRLEGPPKGPQVCGLGQEFRNDVAIGLMADVRRASREVLGVRLPISVQEPALVSK